MAEARHRLRVVTWNVHGCKGRDNRYDPGRIGRQLQTLAPDIAALQEVDSRHGPLPGQDPFDVLVGHVGDHGVRAPAMTTARGHYGQLLASRWPLARHEIHDVTVDDREPRKIIEAHVEPGGIPVRVLATHLGLNRRERKRQLARLRAIIDGGDRGIATLVLGDMNDWRRRGAAHRSLSDILHGGSRHATFPSALPLLPLDRIFWHPPSIMVRTWVVRGDRHASDHLAIAADLEIG